MSRRTAKYEMGAVISAAKAKSLVHEALNLLDKSNGFAIEKEKLAEVALLLEDDMASAASRWLEIRNNPKTYTEDA